MANQIPTHHQHHHHHHQHHHHRNSQQQQQQQRRAVDLRIPAIENTAYCLCLHVKPTTIFIAVFKLIRALLFASILLNAEFSINDPALGEIGLAPMDERHRSTVIAVTILTRIIMASVSAVAIYAVISGRAAFLMPLYAMLLVDFFFALPAFYNKDLDPSFADGLTDFNNGKPPYPHSNQYTRYSLMLFSTITMIVKIYFLCVIWKCYRYLRLIELVAPIRLSEMYPQPYPPNSQYPIIRVLGGGGGGLGGAGGALGGGGVVDAGDLAPGHNVPPPPYDSIISSMKPPVYEEAVKSTSNMSAINILANPMDNSQLPAISSQPSTNQDTLAALPRTTLEQSPQDAPNTSSMVTSDGGATTTTTTTTTVETTPSSTAITIDTSNNANECSPSAPTESSS